MDRFKLTTLVDITETGARKGEDLVQSRQQQNFQSVLQTIGLRVNPDYTSAPAKHTGKQPLGTDYEGEHSYGEWEFNIDAEDALTVDMLNSDFNLIPIIPDLHETASFKNNTFITIKKQICNIKFELLDK